MKIVDQSYQCVVPGQNFGTWHLRCYLQIFRSKRGQDIVVVSDMGCETGWFFPYKIEQLAIQIVQKFQLNPDRLVWIEHCPADIDRPKCSGFSQVSFQWKAGKATNPQWQAIDAELAATLKEEMTQLVAV
ncbi:hypothetical protein JOY44_20590 [Phormidium sp. CLA17]|uniref:hypothetical protein n=1 Tax=Leptolyngbya sp. Cla-17 TaxID=2803751 RepID=UPI0014910815|nr:hypothetical protein [Leptolyngbya sp. Cla-17]MBM0743988.1 hypothetical protein [Leptolyngbya sp. Cla-17]